MNTSDVGFWQSDGTCQNCKLPPDYLMVDNAQDWGRFDPMPPYCPNCGKKMYSDEVMLKYGFR